MPADSKNLLYYGDNLDVLRRHVKDESVDLVYLDPPFKSNQDYNAFFQEASDTPAAAQIQAFEDTWTWDRAAAAAYQEIVERGGKLADAIRAFRQFLGESDMLAYLCMMAPRLTELRRVLKDTGSIYLHCDQTASHYLKMLMDAVFQPQNFRSEVMWYYYNKMHDSRKKLFPKATDMIFFYVKKVEGDFTFHQLKEMRDKPIKQLMRKKVGGKMVNAKDDEGHVMYRMKEDRTLDNVWRIPCLQPAAPERLGYPTQKPEALLERILLASSNAGDTVLDPFCGCGTAIAVAHRLGRRWIGIDITHLAINLIRHRLVSAFGETVRETFKVVGEPTTLEDAEALASQDKYQFQFWALGLVGARPEDQKKGKDRGIDGKLTFFEQGMDEQTIIFSVKGGHTGPTDVRDLRGVIDREKAAIGVLISWKEPTAEMRKEAASAEFFKSAWGTYPKLQILTIADLLGGKTVACPRIEGLHSTFKRAPRASGKEPYVDQTDIFEKKDKPKK